MKKSTWISWVDVVAFISFLLLIATGFLMKFILPPGSGGIHGQGEGWRASSRAVSTVWGMTRHEWGNIHFWVSVLFLAVIAIHLYIHWRWIKASFKGSDTRSTRIQMGIGIGALIGLTLLMLALIFGPADQKPRSELLEQRSDQHSPAKQTCTGRYSSPSNFRAA